MAVTTAWFEFDGRRSLEPVHVWLRWHRTGWCVAQTTGAGDLALSKQAPYESYDLQKNGRVVVQPGGGPASLMEAVGARLVSARKLWQEPPGMFMGRLLEFESVTIGIANLGDELVVGAWPHADWPQWGVSGEGSA